MGRSSSKKPLIQGQTRLSSRLFASSGRSLPLSCSPLTFLTRTSKMAGSASFRSRLGLLFCTALLVNLSTATCYYPSGKETYDDVQCEPGEKDSACCGRGSICLDNGLCLSQDQPFGLSRGSCTDRSFSSAKCPTYCSRSHSPRSLLVNG